MSTTDDTIKALMRTGDSFESLARQCGMSAEDFRRQWLEGEKRARAELASCKNHPNRMNVAPFPDRLCDECFAAAKNAGARQADAHWADDPQGAQSRREWNAINHLPKRA